MVPSALGLDPIEAANANGFSQDFYGHATTEPHER